jgi:hypothetical protein
LGTSSEILPGCFDLDYAQWCWSADSRSGGTRPLARFTAPEGFGGVGGTRGFGGGGSRGFARGCSGGFDGCHALNGGSFGHSRIFRQ